MPVNLKSKLRSLAQKTPVINQILGMGEDPLTEGKTTHIIHSMGKTGTTSIKESFTLAHIPFLYAHYLNGPHIPEKLTLDDDFYYVISPIREPVRRNISAFFENYYQHGKATMSDFIHNYPHHVPLLWFDREIKGFWGVDVYEEEFDVDRGWQIYEAEKARILVIRMENFSSWSQAYQALTGEEAPELVHTHKTDETEYKRFLKEEVVPDYYHDFITQTKYARHFYHDFYVNL
jgi:hypothetical protein